MIKLLFLFSVLFSLISIAQTSEVSARYDRIGKYVNGVAFVHKSGLVGFINAQGKEIVKPEYDKISLFGPDNLAYTWKNNLVGLIDINGKIIVNNVYDHIGHFKYNQAFVKKNNLYGVIDLSGNLLVQPLYIKIKHGPYGNLIANNYDNVEIVLKPIK